MHESEIQAREPVRRELAELTARYLRNGGEIETHKIELRELKPDCWRRRSQNEYQGNVQAKKVAEPEKPAKTSIEERLKAEVDEISAEIDELFERLKAKEKNNA